MAGADSVAAVLGTTWVIGAIGGIVLLFFISATCFLVMCYVRPRLRPKRNMLLRKMNACGLSLFFNTQPKRRKNRPPGVNPFDAAFQSTSPMAAAPTVSPVKSMTHDALSESSTMSSPPLLLLDMLRESPMNYGPREGAPSLGLAGFTAELERSQRRYEDCYTIDGRDVSYMDAELVSRLRQLQRRETSVAEFGEFVDGSLGSSTFSFE